jgi:hypothetical protein
MMGAVRAADIDASFAPRRSAAAHTEELDGEAVILDEAHNRLHLLNRSATTVWLCFDGRGSITAVARDLATVIGQAEDTTTAEVLDLARALGAEGLLDRVEPDPDRLARLED